MAPVRRLHPVTEQDLHAFVDGELDGEGYRAVVAHLAISPDAGERVGDLLRQQGRLAALREQLGDAVDPPPDERTEALMQGLAGALRYRRRARRSLVSGLALTLVVGLWGLWGLGPRVVAERLPWPSSPSSDGPRVLFGHDPYGAARPAVADASESASAWLDRQLAANAMGRPDLSAYGLRLVGSDALRSGDTPAVRLTYEDAGGEPVFLFVGSVAGGDGVALTLVPEGQVSFNWRRGSLVFVLIGPKQSEQLLAAVRDAGGFLTPSPGPAPETTAETADKRT
jgi:anti-sigma factor RsiW